MLQTETLAFPASGTGVCSGKNYRKKRYQLISAGPPSSSVEQRSPRASSGPLASRESGLWQWQSVVPCAERSSSIPSCRSTDHSLPTGEQGPAPKDRVACARIEDPSQRIAMGAWMRSLPLLRPVSLSSSRAGLFVCGDSEPRASALRSHGDRLRKLCGEVEPGCGFLFD